MLVETLKLSFFRVALRWCITTEEEILIKSIRSINILPE